LAPATTAETSPQGAKPEVTGEKLGNPWENHREYIGKMLGKQPNSNKHGKNMVKTAKKLGKT
jgi:hypothetical protein